MALEVAPTVDIDRLKKAVLDEATHERWGDLHSIRWASETFAALVAERYAGTMPIIYVDREPDPFVKTRMNAMRCPVCGHRLDDMDGCDSCAADREAAETEGWDDE